MVSFIQLHSPLEHISFDEVTSSRRRRRYLTLDTLITSNLGAVQIICGLQVQPSAYIPAKVASQPRHEILRPIAEAARCSNELSRGVHGEPDARTLFSRLPSKLSENLIGINCVKLARAIGSHAVLG